MKTIIMSLLLSCLPLSSMYSMSNQVAATSQETALIKAIDAKDRDAVKRLIQQGVDVNEVDQYGYPPIVYLSVWALSEQMRPHVVPVLEKLLNAGALPDKTGDYGDTALMWFAGDGCVEAVTLLLNHGAQVNALNQIKQSALSYASHNNRGDIAGVVKALLDARADIDQKGGADENSPLLEAIKCHGFMGKNTVPVVTLLLECGAATDLKNKKGKMSRQVMNDVRCHGEPLPSGDPLRVVVNAYAFKNKKNK
jgi:ankyrin repeat protein